LVGRRRVLDSTPVYDAVATMDTVTLVRSAIRGLLAVSGPGLGPELRGLLRRDDDYRAAGKPVCDYEDPVARQELVDGLAKDARALLVWLDGRALSEALEQAAALLASVTGQDLDEGADGVFRIARRVAKDRIISTVDTDARHGHKSSAHGFDGYKGHVAIDPDSELITATAVTAGNVGDAQPVTELLVDDLPAVTTSDQDTTTDQHADTTTDTDDASAKPACEGGGDDGSSGERLSVYGDSAYGAGTVLDTLEHADAQIMCKVQPPSAPGGRFSKDEFQIDLDAGTVTCPAAHTAVLRTVKDGQIARFGEACAACPLAGRCTTSSDGRTIHVGPHEQALTRARARQTDPEWKADYTATRPKVERKISHLMRRRHGGRRARVRGKPKVTADFALLAAAVNLRRLALLGLACHEAGWQATTA
ncbi:MAG: transposase, partial [Pseudonocardiaceae bacterium]